MKKKVTKKGRPPIENAASERMQLRMTGDQKKRWSKAAEKAGMTLSAWIKTALDKTAK